MDEDLRADLQDLSKHVQDVGRFIGSKKRTVEDLISMKECLENAAVTLSVYIKIQSDRNAEV